MPTVVAGRINEYIQESEDCHNDENRSDMKFTTVNEVFILLRFKKLRLLANSHMCTNLEYGE